MKKNQIDRLTELAAEPDIAFVAGVLLGSLWPPAIFVVAPAVLGYRVAKRLQAGEQPEVVVERVPVTNGPSA